MGDSDTIHFSEKTQLHPFTDRDDMAFCRPYISDHIYVCSSI